METLISLIPQLWANRRAESLLVMAAVITVIISMLIYLNSHSSSSTAPNIVISEKKNSTKKQRTIVVYIAGAVIKPGMYSLQEGSRLNDLIESAGGLSEDAATTFIERSFNRAHLLVDEDKYYLPHLTEITQASEAVLGSMMQSSSDEKQNEKKVSVNKGSLSELDTLPGIGAVTAQKIIQGRPYKDTEELLSKKIVKKSVYENIKSLIVL